MKTRPARQVLQSFFGGERRGAITRLLYAIIVNVIIIDTIMILIHQWDTTLAAAITLALFVLLLLVFYIRGNGVGIQAQYIDKIFGLLNMLDVHTEGMGVGLALVKHIVEFHGGRVWVESEPGRRMTFFFTLPTPSHG